MTESTKPRVLIVYHTFSQQTGRVAEAMAQAFTARDCEADESPDRVHRPRCGQKLLRAPDVLAGPGRPDDPVSPQRRRKTGEIRIPPEAQEGDYDLIVIGSPTWWLTTNMPIRSYLKSTAARDGPQWKALWRVLGVPPLLEREHARCPPSLAKPTVGGGLIWTLFPVRG